MQIVPADLKSELDGVIFKAFMIGLAVEFAGAFVQQIRDEIRGSSFISLVLARSAMEGVIERDERHCIFMNEPRFDA